MDALNSIPVLFVRGSHYNIGFQTGKNFRSRITDFYCAVGELEDQWVPFYNTPKGRELYDGYLQVVQEDYPQYLEEVRGIADGAQIPFFKVFLMHIRKELQIFTNMESAPECSTVFVNNLDMQVLCHNEDTAPEVRATGYVLVCNVQGEDGVSCEKFLSFCYPGIIPGNSMNYTGTGFALTINALYPQLVLPNKTRKFIVQKIILTSELCIYIKYMKLIPARQFCNRATLAAKNLNHLDSILLDKSRGIATGFSINVAWAQDSCMYNKEVSPRQSQNGSCVTTVTISQTQSGLDDIVGTYDHFNAYKHTDVVEVPGFGVSSKHRQARADSLKKPINLQDALNVLGDNEDSEYPIYRIPSQTDQGCTVATGVFSFVKQEFSLFTDNPKNSCGPLVRLPFSILQ